MKQAGEYTWRFLRLCGRDSTTRVISVNGPERFTFTSTIYCIRELMSTPSQGISGPNGRIGLQPNPVQLLRGNCPMSELAPTQTSLEQSTANQIRKLTVRLFINSLDLILAHNIPCDISTLSNRSWRCTRYRRAPCMLDEHPPDLPAGVFCDEGEDRCSV